MYLLAGPESSLNAYYNADALEQRKQDVWRELLPVEEATLLIEKIVTDVTALTPSQIVFFAAEYLESTRTDIYVEAERSSLAYAAELFVADQVECVARFGFGQPEEHATTSALSSV